MKSTLPALLLCFCLLSISAQTPGDHQFQFQFSNTLREWIKGPDGAWFGIGWTESHPGYPRALPFVLKWDAQSDSILWKKEVPMPLAETMHDVALLPSPDGGAFVGAVYDGCDYSTKDGVAKLGPDGSILWVKHTEIENDYYAKKVWLIPYPSGRFLFHTNAYQIEYDADGVLKWKDPVPFDWNGVAKRNTGGYLVYGNKKIATTNLFLSIIPVPFSDNILHAIQLPSNAWYFLGETKIFATSSSFFIVNQKSLPNLTPWSKIYEVEGNYWVTGENPAGEAVLMQIDPGTLEVVGTHISGANYRIKDIPPVVTSKGVWLSGDCNFERNQTVFLNAVPKTSPVLTPSRSASVTDIRLTSIPYVSPQSNCWPPNAAFRIEVGPVYAMVKNTGPETISYFRVNCSFNRCSFICEGYDQYSVAFEEPLDPGESVELLLFDDLILTGQAPAPLLNLCIWTALPDERIDAKPEDDRLCKEFSVTVSDNEPATADARVRIFPNPSITSTTFYMDGSNEDAFVLTLYDVAGRQVAQEQFVGKTWTLEHGSLPAGLYIYHISSRREVLGSGRLVFSER
jgi:hypothetical protein